MDIVEWLQDNATETGGYLSHERRMFIKAADEIERLRAEVIEWQQHHTDAVYRAQTAEIRLAEAIEALRQLHAVAERYCDAVDGWAEDIGGEDPNKVLRELGPEIIRARDILSQLPEKSDG